jgi:outer membrane biosynthesis protein TonB
MMRLWANSYAKATPVMTSATLSIVAHTLIIGAWIVATLPSAELPSDSFANRTYPKYQPPPDRSPGHAGTRETVHYIDLSSLEGFGAGDGGRTMGDEAPHTLSETVGRAAPPDSVTSEATAPVAGPQDSVFSILEVDTAVVRAANSAAPAYPLKLLVARIMGSVAARYVVDTTGFADTTSFEVLKPTNPEFVTAVKEALPYMRFTPAKIGSMKVRQLVEQQFTFKIADTVTVAAPVAKKKP